MNPACPHRDCGAEIVEAFVGPEGEQVLCSKGHISQVNADGGLRPIRWQAAPPSNEPVSALLITAAVLLLVGAFLIYTIFIAGPR